MTLREIFEKRRSIRKYNEGTIGENQLQMLKEAAQIAPSASNRQPYQFIIVQDEELKKKVGKLASYQKFISKAAVIIVGIGDPEQEKWYKVDIAIAMQHIVLQATELGLGTCWIGSFDEEKIKDLLKIPSELNIVAMLPVGIAAQNPPARPRKSLDTLFMKNYFKKQEKIIE